MIMEAALIINQINIQQDNETFLRMLDSGIDDMEAGRDAVRGGFWENRRVEKYEEKCESVKLCVNIIFNEWSRNWSRVFKTNFSQKVDLST